MSCLQKGHAGARSRTVRTPGSGAARKSYGAVRWYRGVYRKDCNLRALCLQYLRLHPNALANCNRPREHDLKSCTKASAPEADSGSAKEAKSRSWCRYGGKCRLTLVALAISGISGSSEQRAV